MMLDAHGLLVADLAVRLQGLLRVHLRLMNPRIDFCYIQPILFLFLLPPRTLPAISPTKDVNVGR